MAARLPVVGNDLNDWGSVLNAFLLVAHNPDGTLITPGFSNPMTTPGDLILGSAGGLASRLGIGGNGQYLSVNNGSVQWSNPPGGFTNPMTSLGDIITGLANGVAARLAIGATGQVLTISGGVPVWATPASGFANPMTSPGDLITATTGGSPQRLAAGALNQILSVTATGVLGWINSPSGFSNPMTAAGDIITGASGGSAQRLPVGSNGQILGVVSGSPAWVTNTATTALTGPSPSQPTVFKMPDGSIAVIPLATYSLSGDDGQWITAAFTFGLHVLLSTGTFSIQSSVTIPFNAHVAGGGPGTILSCQFAGQNFVWHNTAISSAGPAYASYIGGTLRDFILDGTTAPTGAYGLHYGDAWGQSIIDVTARNFTTTGTYAIYCLNQYTWSEKTLIRVSLINNANPLTLDGGGSGSASASMEYNYYDLKMIAQGNQNGVVLTGGAYLTGGTFRLVGNMYGGGNSAAVTIQGTGGPGAVSSKFNDMAIQITMEYNPTTGAAPQTIHLGSSGNEIVNCTGIMTFGGSAWTVSNAVAGQFSLGGIVQHDSVLIALNGAITPSGWPGTNASLAPYVTVPASGDTTGATDAAAIQAQFTAGNSVALEPSGQYYLKATENTANGTACGIFIPQDSALGGGPALSLYGDPSVTVFIVGAGSGIYMHRKNNYGNQYGLPAQEQCGRIWGGFQVDGTNATGSAVGVDVGDGWGMEVDVAIHNFTGASQIGCWAINRVFWSEKHTLKLHLKNNTAGFVMDALNSADISHEYCTFDLWFFCNSTHDVTNPQQGVIMQNGVYCNGSTWKVKGNFEGANTGTAAGPVFTIKGNDGVGDNTNLANCFMDVVIEANNSSYSIGVLPFLFGSTANTFGLCTGYLNFQFSPVAATNPAVGQFQFDGIVSGDNTLRQVTTPAVPASGTAYTNNQNPATVYIATGAGVTVSQIQVANITTGVTIPASSSAGGFHVPANRTIKLTYSGGTPTWQFVADK